MFTSMINVIFFLSVQCAVTIMCALVLNEPFDSVSSYHLKLMRHNFKTPAPDHQVQTTTASSQSCGHGLCLCRKGPAKAECSHHSTGLQYIPPLPNYVQYLYFSYNHLTSIPANFFMNVTGTALRFIDLSHNSLANISANAFFTLRHLKVLYLSSNPDLSYASLAPVFMLSSLEELDIMSCRLGPPPADLFHNANLPQLRYLLLHDNRLGLGLMVFDLSLFKPLAELRELGLASNDIIYVGVNYTTKLEKLNLDSNSIFDFPATCCYEHAPEHLFPKLRYLFLQGNQLHTLPRGNICLPSLELIALGKNMFSYISTDSFSADNFPSLKQISLYAMRTLISVIEDNAFNNSLLERIDLAFTNIHFSSHGISSKSFANCPNLQILQMAHTILEVDDDRFLQLFGLLTNLRRLDLQNSRLTHISSQILANFHNLRNLQLNRNLLTSLPDGVFNHLGRLQQLDLSRNQIRVVSPNTFGQNIQHSLRSLDLSGNLFTCSCDILWFQAWMASSPSLFNHSWSNYTCHNIPDMRVLHFFVPSQACMISEGMSIMAITGVSFVIITLLVVLTLFHFRWHLRLLLYEAFRGRGDIRRRRLELGHFDYDLFVSYDSADLPWVRQYLLHHLEEELSLRLCIHERDFIVGRDVVDNIADSVERSKKVMMLFSRSFARSQWCQFELSFCLRRVMDYDDTLIIVCLDDVCSHYLTPAMMAVLKITTYIQWISDPNAIASFWGRLNIALQEVMQYRHV